MVLVNNWAFRQVFGDRDSNEDPAEEDLISAVRFDANGDYLATGDRGGRVVIFESSEVGHRAMLRDNSTNSSSEPPPQIEYRFYCEFQSHEPEFDYLKSVEIEEKINRIRWRPARAEPLFLLSTNDKKIKLWKIYEKKVRMVASKPSNSASSSGQPSPFVRQLLLPKLMLVQSIATAALKKTFANGHIYHINSLSFCADGETYLSADDLRIHLWHLDAVDTTFNALDIKPNDMEDLSEVITAAEFHPTYPNSMAYASSKGLVRLCDLRQSAVVQPHDGIVFGHTTPPTDRTFFSEVISSISDVKFSHRGDHLMVRDYMTLKLWDVRRPSAPIHVIKVHDQLQPKLCELYENDCIFDKFECSWGAGDTHVCSGTYDNKMLLWDAFQDGPPIALESVSSTVSPTRRNTLKGKLGLNRKESVGSKHFAKKALHHAHHPTRNLIAVGARNALYIFASR